MKKIIILLLSVILCLQFAACDTLLESLEQLNKNDKPDEGDKTIIETENPSHVFSTADGSSLEISLTRGSSTNASSVIDQWSNTLDISDQSKYGNALSSLRSAKLIAENGKLDPDKWLESSAGFVVSDSGELKTESAKTLDSVGTYTDGAYQVNDSYGVRAVGALTDKGFEVHACIVDLAFRSANGGSLSLCTGESGSTIKSIMTALGGNAITNNTISPKTTTPNISVSYVSFDSSNVRLVFFDTETFEILGMAAARTKSTSASASPKTSSGSSSSIVISGSNNGSLTIVALDENGNEIDGNLNLGELLPGETRRVSVLFYKEPQTNTLISGNKDKEDNKDNKKEEGEYDSNYSGNDSAETTEAETVGRGEIIYEGKVEIMTGNNSPDFEYESFQVQFSTSINVSCGYSFNLIFTDK